MATEIRTAVNKIAHDNYNAAVTAATKTLPAGSVTNACVSLLIHNTDTSINISVSFDAGTTWKIIPAGSSLALEVSHLPSYQVKSASGTPAVECLYGYEG